MAWTIEYTKTAAKILTSIDRQISMRIKKYLEERIATEEDPRRFGEALPANLTGFWKYRIGDYRVIAEIQDERVVVVVVKIGHRSKVYKNINL